MVIFEIVGFLILALYAILIATFSYGWFHLPTYQIPKDFIPHTFISVVIPARNEAHNIEKCLQSILANDYPKELLEIIVVDDCSEDETFEITSHLLEKENGKVLKMKDFLVAGEKINSFKKKALGLAIKQASGALIVSTDADCVVSPIWLKEIAGFYESKHPKAIIAPVSFLPFAPKKKNWLYYFQSLDFMTMQGITAATIRLKIGSMSNGANLAFEKRTFNQVNGYEGINKLASGDDMFLIEKIKEENPNGVLYLKSTHAIVQTACQSNLKSFFNQRRRWASKSGKYKDKTLTQILAVVYFFNLFIGTYFLLSFFGILSWYGLFTFLLAKILIEILFLLPVANFYKKVSELIIFPFLQPFHILYIISIGFLGMTKTYQWKGRKVK